MNSPKLHKGIYLLPNLFTTAGLLAGFFAIVSCFSQNFELAAIAIFVAMVMDGIDGRVARMTNTQSEFGAEYDSLADMISFCVAPAILAWQWAMADIGKIGWIAAFVFVACGALRLARFNTQVGTADKRYFQGLATPSSAAVMAGMVWAAPELGINEPQSISVLIAIIAVLLGLLNVSNFRYHSFKAVNWKQKVPFLSGLIAVIIVAVIASDPPTVLFVGFSLYALSGPIETLWRIKELKASRQTLRRDIAEENLRQEQPTNPTEDKRRDQNKWN